MSKFIDGLKKITKTEAASMGFRRVTAESQKKKMHLVASVAGQEKPEGADSVLLDITGNVDEAALKGMSGDTVWGAWLKDADAESVAKLKEAGCDYVVFSPDMPVSNASDKEIGKILEIDTSIHDYLVRTLMHLPVDAVLVNVPQTGNGLTYGDIMAIQRFGGPGKPLLVKLTAAVSVAELEALWQAGVLAVVAGNDIDALRKAIDSAEFKSKADRDKEAPRIGLGQVSSAAAPEDDADDDDDY